MLSVECAGIGECGSRYDGADGAEVCCEVWIAAVEVDCCRVNLVEDLGS